MSERTKRSDVYERVIKLSARVPIRLDSHAQGMRITTQDQGRDISPRLSVSDMMTWLDGFEAGLDSLEKDAKILAQLAEGLDITGKAGPLNQDFIDAYRRILGHA